MIGADGSTSKAAQAGALKKTPANCADAPGGFTRSDTAFRRPEYALARPLEIVRAGSVQSKSLRLRPGTAKAGAVLGGSDARCSWDILRFEPKLKRAHYDARRKVHTTAITEIKNLHSFSVLARGDGDESNGRSAWEESGQASARRALRVETEAPARHSASREKKKPHDYRLFPTGLVTVEGIDALADAVEEHGRRRPAARRKEAIRGGDRLSPPGCAAHLAGDREARRVILKKPCE